MPEIQHTFTSGKMNKDLDERLLPPGQYRDALNVQVSGSDGDDVGAAQNILGNTKIGNHTIAGGKCIGVVSDTENEKIYWFIAGNTVDAIAEFDQLSGQIKPVVLDTASVLNFSKEITNRITGINLIDGMLFWTDNNSEPKVINIQDCIDGSSGWSTHTQLKDIAGTLYNFTEADITVIKNSPKVEPTLTMANTKRVTLGGATGVTTSTVNFDFGDGGNPEAPLAKGSVVSLSFNNSPTFLAGDTLILSSGDDANGFDDEYQIRVKINPGYSYPASTFQCTIQSISENVPTTATQWEVNLKQDDALFEKEFVRFAYRYKYKNGEYSCFSPFSEVAFLPKTFEYDPSKGFNLGMVNDLRYLKITNFIPSDIPKQVKEIDILFKKENNTNIYVAKTIKYGDTEWSSTGTWELETEMIYKTVETNQLLRPFDSVPLKAKAQELVANRIVYGNYTQNFDLIDSSGIEITPKFETVSKIRSLDVAREPGRSLKSQRTYQLGVVYRDQYGRETPVQADDSGSFTLSKDDAINRTQIQANIISSAPSFATHYKFFIKDTSNSYYNLCMDRHYDAEDGNVWLTFPSSERNKLDEETFIILKKEHDSDDFVVRDAKYKVIAIENSAPTELKETKVSYGELTTGFASDAYPLKDGKYVDVDKDDFETRFGENSDILSASGLIIRIRASVGTSDWYEVSSLGLNSNASGTGDDEYRFNIKKKFGSEVEQFFPDGSFSSAVAGMTLEIARLESKNKAEFTGRFFVKVYRDQALQEHILSTQASDPSYSVKHQQGIYKRSGGCNSSAWGDYEDLGVNYRWFTSFNCGIEDFKGAAYGTKPSLAEGGKQDYKYGITANKNKIVIHFHGNRQLSGVFSQDNGQHANMATALTTDGTKFRFSEDSNGTIYEIKKHAYRGIRLFDKASAADDGWWRNQAMIFVLELDKNIYGWDFNSNVSNSTFGNIELLQTFDEDNTYKSQNPAVWETEPKEAIEMDIYYEASKAYAIATHGTAQLLDYSNCWSFGNGVESNRIRDDFNTMTIAKGVKASAPLAEQYKEEVRKNGLIFSGLYNSTSGINRLNQFIIAEPIVKDLNPEYGSIQKLNQRDTDLTVCCEDKILKVLANKDALFEASGNAQLTATNRVLGQAVPYIGDFGISKNPESFASYGFRSYFTDKARGVVLRLSRDGLSEISAHGMKDYFKDNLALNELFIGSHDDAKGLYNISMQHASLRGTEDTVSFKEQVTGWPSRKSFIPEAGVSLNNVYYTFRLGQIYSHDNPVRNNFYATQYDSKVKLIFNETPSTIKSFKTISYEGSRSRILQDLRVSSWDADGAVMTAGDTEGSLYNINETRPGWYVNNVVTDKQSGFVPEFIEKEGKWFNFVKGDATTKINLDTKEFNIQGIGNPSNVADSSAPTQVTITIEENNL